MTADVDLSVEFPLKFLPDHDGDSVSIDGSDSRICVHVESTLVGDDYSAFISGREIDHLIVALIKTRPDMAWAIHAMMEDSLKSFEKGEYID